MEDLQCCAGSANSAQLSAGRGLRKCLRKLGQLCVCMERHQLAPSRAEAPRYGLNDAAMHAVEDLECCAGGASSAQMSAGRVPKKCLGKLDQLDACIERHQLSAKPG